MSNVAFAYVRVSQEDENPENQKYAIREFCRQQGLVCIIFEEPPGTSGATDPFERPVFSQMWKQMIESGVRKLIVTDVDRISRDVEQWKKFFRQALEHDIEIVSIADKDLVESVSRIVDSIRQLKSRVSDKAVVREFIEYQVEQAEKYIELYFRLRVAAAEDYRKSVIEKTRVAIQKLKALGLLYHRPTIIHYLAMFITGKSVPKELTKDDLLQAREIFCKFVEEYASRPLNGSVRAAWRAFLEKYKKLYERFPSAPRSYVTFLNTYKRVCVENR